MIAKTKEYQIFEVDKYGNRFFEISYSGVPEVQKVNAERFVQNDKSGRDFVIVEVS